MPAPVQSMISVMTPPGVILKGMYQEAIASLKRAIDREGAAPDADLSAYLAYTYGVAGMYEEAQEILESLAQPSNGRQALPPSMALVHIGLGKEDQAFEWLEKAYGQRDGQLIGLGIDPQRAALRDDPRHHDLSRQMGLPLNERFDDAFPIRSTRSTGAG